MARKKQNKKTVEPKKRKLGRYVLLFMLVIGAGVQFRHYDLQQYLPSFEVTKDLDIAEVIVDGSFVYSDPMKLQLEIEKKLKSDFLRLSLESIRQALLEEPWYQSVSVERVWPATLKVRVVEHQPIAVWNGEGFINRSGDVVYVDNIEVLEHLPGLNGKNNQAYKITERYLTMSKLLNRQGLYITSMSVDKSGDWSLELNEQFDVKLGQKNISDRLDKFLGLYTSSLVSKRKYVDSIDMRYRSGAAVSWKNEDGSKHNHEIAGRY
jgi:cell division protein FtsQ